MFDPNYNPSIPEQGSPWVVWHQYFVSMVFSSIGLALVTTNPMTTMQAIFISVMILLSVFFMAWLYGEFSN